MVFAVVGVAVQDLSRWRLASSATPFVTLALSRRTKYQNQRAIRHDQRNQAPTYGNKLLDIASQPAEKESGSVII
ncbi:hypothetical protein NKH99_14700 [Mesorhizobium sp. M0854]|uniref:hypothetical protein n=1 Tax=Mesorhizobium sp. M0854 TaxID=2957013 RepID=UPI0033392DA6